MCPRQPFILGPISNAVRDEALSLTNEGCTFEYEARPEHFKPNGILHGGALYTVMDTSQGMLVMAQLEGTPEFAATGTATIKYLAPVRSGKLTIHTSINQREGRKLFVHSEATDPAGRAVALLDEIWITLPRPA